MGRLKWYKRDPDAALAGMACLTLEECGAYNLVLDLIYSREGNLEDDDYEVARLLRCDVRVWKRIKRRLVDLEKLFVNGGKLRNPKADVVIGKALSVSTSAALAGIASGESRRCRANIIKGLDRTNVQRPFEPLRTKIESKITSTEFGTAREEEANRRREESVRGALARREARNRRH